MAKVELFDKELQDTSAVFKVLSHPARLAILKYLADTKTCISGDISGELPLSRTTVHQHLQELKKIGLIKGEISGVKTNYCLNTDSIKEIGRLINSFLSGIECCSEPICSCD